MPELHMQPLAGGRLQWIIAALVVVLTAIVFSGVTRLDWTNWDDDLYVYENDMVIRGDYAAIFTTPVSGNYNPLSIATHAWEWQQVGNWPWFYHFNNLWMHLVCTALVYLLMLRLGLVPWWAGFAALWFGIHPLRVESVAWVTERKDVLYGMFYLGALLAYLRYLETKRLQPYLFCLLLFGLSLLSKIQAVSLPLSMLAIDWYRMRKWEGRVIWEKVPFFIGSAVIGYVGLVFLKADGALGMNDSFGIVERLVLGMFAFSVYVVKAVVPYENSLLYPYPDRVGGMHYLGILGTAVIVAGAILVRKRLRAVTFGVVFFAVNIVFLLQIVDAGNAYLADRFTYIASIGLYFALAMAAQQLSQRKKVLLPVAVTIGLLLSGIFGWLTLRYIPAWQNSETIWTDVIAKYPRKLVFSYINRGDYYYVHRQRDYGLADFTTAIALYPDYYMGYLRRGDVYFLRNEVDSAITDYTRVLELAEPIDMTQRVNPVIAQAWSSRGALYARKGLYAQALADLDKALRFYPDDKNTLSNRAIAYMEMKEYSKAIADFTAFLKHEPKSAMALGNRAYCYLQTEQWALALEDLNLALRYDPQNPVLARNREIAEEQLKIEN
jgi:protein O-mannosyl-transferase